MATPPQLKCMQLICAGGRNIYKMQPNWYIPFSYTPIVIHEAWLKYRSLDRLKTLSVICPPHRKKSFVRNSRFNYTLDSTVKAAPSLDLSVASGAFYNRLLESSFADACLQYAQHAACNPSLILESASSL
ncbi:hypothetical protein EVAR_38065_1 [Eumeta japonica]|uniref:Uncharacterized protein n=1 Tax=Eumeta variegata TaxID=151549 RepID=A0A4C1W8B1_EUMVA|nr:hypothetical protein EVAR_38065_1 [Eumeta japonica]